MRRGRGVVRAEDIAAMQAAMGDGGVVTIWPRRRWFRRRRVEPMPPEFEKLAIFNAEVARGIQHTPEWKFGMEYLQDRFNEWARIRR